MADLDAALDAEADDAVMDEVGASAGLRFCRECNMMLYPKEDRSVFPPKLIFKCTSEHNDGYQEDAICPVVHSNKIVAADAAVNLDVIPQDIITDPTLRRQETTCPACGHNQAVVLQAVAGRNSKKLTLIFVCTAPECRHKWVSSTS